MNDRFRPAARVLALMVLIFVLVVPPGCAEEEDPPGLPGAGGGIAVVGSDYTSTVISLVDPGSGKVVRDRCFDSGSRAPQLSAALSGDVTLPSEPQPGHELLVIDRMNGTLTWLDSGNCQVLRQMSAGDGFSANPQDVVAGSGNKAYVTRYDHHPTRREEGSDLLIIDRMRATVLGRIALPAPAPTDLPAGQTISPRPTRALRIGDRLYVALNNLSDDFGSATPGRIAVVDTTSDSVVVSIDLPGLKNCGGLVRTRNPAGRDALVVGCSGVYFEGPRQIETAGFAWVDLDTTPPAVQVVPGRTFEREVSGSVMAVVGSDLAFTVLPGDPVVGVPEAVWAFDFRGGKPRKILESRGGAFVLSLALAPSADRLYVLDAGGAQPQVQVFALGADRSPTPSGSFVASPATGLPPRHLGFY